MFLVLFANQTASFYSPATLLLELTAARGDGSYSRLIHQLSNYDLLVMDDWGLAPLGLLIFSNPNRFQEG